MQGLPPLEAIAQMLLTGMPGFPPELLRALQQPAPAPTQPSQHELCHRLTASLRRRAGSWHRLRLSPGAAHARRRPLQAPAAPAAAQGLGPPRQLCAAQQAAQTRCCWWPSQPSELCLKILGPVHAPGLVACMQPNTEPLHRRQRQGLLGSAMMRHRPHDLVGVRGRSPCWCPAALWFQCRRTWLPEAASAPDLRRAGGRQAQSP